MPDGSGGGGMEKADRHLHLFLGILGVIKEQPTLPSSLTSYHSMLTSAIKQALASLHVGPLLTEHGTIEAAAADLGTKASAAKATEPDDLQQTYLEELKDNKILLKDKVHTLVSAFNECRQFLA